MDTQFYLWKKIIKEEIKREILEEIEINLLTNSIKHNDDQFLAFKEDVGEGIEKLNHSIKNINKQIRNLKKEITSLNSNSMILMDNQQKIIEQQNQTFWSKAGNQSIRKLQKKKSQETTWFNDKLSNIISQISDNPEQQINIEHTLKINSKKSLKDLPAQNQDIETNKEGGPLKRPKNTFLLFKDEVYQHVKAKNPNMKSSDITKIIGKLWENCDEGTKARLQAQYQKNKQKFDQQNTIFEDDIGKYQRRKKI